MATTEELIAAIHEVLLQAPPGTVVEPLSVANTIVALLDEKRSIEEVQMIVRREAQAMGIDVMDHPPRRSVGPEDEECRVLPGEGGANDD
jgi:hypothetical protein